jgi:hypothetical protein
MSSTELGTPHRLRTKMVVMLADLVYRIPYIASSVSSYLDISSYQLIDGQKRIKQYLYPDYYYNHEEQDWHELESHAGMHPNTTIPCILLTCFLDHCLESLRQTLMCQPDVSVYTLEWTPHSRVKPTVRVPQAHACVDWSALHEWMLERAGKLEDMVPPDPSLYPAKGEGN